MNKLVNIAQKKKKKKKKTEFKLIYGLDNKFGISLTNKLIFLIIT